MKKSLWAVLTLAILVIAITSYCVWSTFKLKHEFDDLSFQQTSSDYSHDNDLLSPDVGSIQFLHRGYTITFNSLTYAPGGLEVTGTIGNPTQLNISSLNLKLSARPFLYKNRNAIIKDPWFMFGGAGEIGSGQTTILYLPAGKTASFSMTIPNVKQTSDGFQIAALFSGERYSY